MVNRNGELVGLIFDGSVQSLSASCVDTDEQRRAASVGVRAILEALDNVYAAKEWLADLPSW